MEKKVKISTSERIDLWMDKGIKGTLKLLAIGCLAAGIYSGMWHCFMLAGMSAALLWAIKHEDSK